MPFGWAAIEDASRNQYLGAVLEDHFDLSRPTSKGRAVVVERIAASVDVRPRLAEDLLSAMSCEGVACTSLA